MKRTRIKPFLLTFIVLIVVFVAGKYALDFLFADMCGNEITQKMSSPDNKKVAYIFIRNCGATTGLSYQLSLLGSGDKLENTYGNTFISDKKFNLKWLSNKRVQVIYKKSSLISP